MAEVKVITWKKHIVKMSKPDIIRLQISVHCHLQGIKLSPADLNCLTLLGEKGRAGLSNFCLLLTDNKVFKSMQGSRNAVTRLQKKDLIIKEGRNTKNILLHPDLKIQNSGNVLVDIKCFSPS